MADYVLRDRRLADLDPELEQLTVDPRGTPEWVGLRHLADEITDVRGNRPPTRPPGSALPSPVQTEPSPVPSDDGLGLDEGQRLSPVGPDSGQNDPQGSVSVRQAGSFRVPLEDIELMAECEVLQG